MRPFGRLHGLDEARRALAALGAPVAGVERVPLSEAHGRVLAADLAAPIDVPGFDRSAMDGWALRAADSGAGARLPVVGRVPAGEPFGRPLPPGAAVEIATGGAIPEGADCVVPFEQARPEPGGVVLERAARAGDFVSARGGDVPKGDVVLAAGAVLSAARVALVGSLGLASVAVRRRPVVAILPSGTEVVAPGAPRPASGVYDGNSFALAALARRHGGAPRPAAVAPDREDAFAAALEEAARGADVLVTTGGSSVGDRDLLRATVEAAGGDVLLHGLRLRPGKPVLVGRVHGVPLLGLPGYPASTVVTGEVLLVPLVRALAGLPPAEPALRRARLAAPVAKPADVTLVLPLDVDEGGVGRNTYKESGTLTSVTGSWGYVEVPEGVEAIPAGAEVEVRAWS